VTSVHRDLACKLSEFHARYVIWVVRGRSIPVVLQVKPGDGDRSDLNSLASAGESGCVPEYRCWGTTVLRLPEVANRRKQKREPNASFATISPLVAARSSLERATRIDSCSHLGKLRHGNVCPCSFRLVACTGTRNATSSKKCHRVQQRGGSH